MIKVLQMCEDLGITKTPTTNISALSKSVKSELLRLYVKKDSIGFEKKLKEAPSLLQFELNLDKPIRAITKAALIMHEGYALNAESDEQSGNILSEYILEVLKGYKLSVKQKGKLYRYVTIGDWNPAGIDLKEALEEIVAGNISQDVDSLLELLRDMRAIPKGTAIRYFLDDAECSATVFNDMDNVLGFREIKGADAPSEETNSVWEGLREGSARSSSNNIMKNNKGNTLGVDNEDR